MSTQMKDRSSESRQACLDGRVAKDYGSANVVRESSLDEINQQIANYFKTQPIVKAWLFGSFARGEETPLSDVDILVEYAEGGISLLKHCAMINDLEALLDRPVDLIEDGTLLPFAVESANRDKILIYERAA